MRIGIYGGSFDPPHKGHENLACQMIEQLHLDELRIFPAYISPFKVDRLPTASAEERLAMLHLIFDKVNKVVIDDFEIESKKISYTIDTIRYMKKKFPKDDLFLVMSQETKKDFPKWNEAEEIKKLVSIAYAVPKATGEEGEVVIPWVDIHSTTIRNHLEKCKKFLDSKVLDFISEHQIYL